jgi:HD-GYP domain-containing protein (c-di-GMP phosphodiesterase class II)
VLITDNSRESPQDILSRDREAQPSDRAKDELRRMRQSVICGLNSVLQMKDVATRVHSRRLVEWAVHLGGRLGLDTEYQEDLETAALLHDIGKIGVPDAILNKPGPLTREERLIINKHPEYGWNVLHGIPGFERVSLFVLHHHERIDGKGYPSGLSGEAIPLGSRIIGLIDAFDAMTSMRCYRKAVPLDEAVRRLEAGRGTQFDPRLVEHLVSMVASDLVEASGTIEILPVRQLALAEVTL